MPVVAEEREAGEGEDGRAAQCGRASLLEDRMAGE
jgi:hypothetical protein